jgi:adenine C2-methylase RlmN of 23S rRNA A2503 and tRNA A37
MMNVQASQSDYNENSEELSDADRTARLIDEYVNLQRIRDAADPNEEIALQLRVVKAKLDLFKVNPKSIEMIERAVSPREKV